MPQHLHFEINLFPYQFLAFPFTLYSEHCYLLLCVYVDYIIYEFHFRIIKGTLQHTCYTEGSQSLKRFRNTALGLQEMKDSPNSRPLTLLSFGPVNTDKSSLMPVIPWTLFLNTSVLPSDIQFSGSNVYLKLLRQQDNEGNRNIYSECHVPRICSMEYSSVLFSYCFSYHFKINLIKYTKTFVIY